MPLTDVFVATESEARALQPGEEPLAKHAGADLKGVEVVKLEQLLRLVQDREFDPEMERFPMIAELSDQGPWIVQFAPALAEFLADLDEEQAARWGERWAQIEEFELDGFTPADVTSVLRDLVHVSRQARDAGKPMFVWMSL
jgi:hypothetical protein